MNRKLLSSVLLSIALMSSSANAINIDSIDISWETPRVFTVSGRGDSESLDEAITIEILNPGKTMSDFTLKKQGQTYFLKVGQVKTDVEGKFTYSFNIEDATVKSGEFMLRIKDSAEETDVTETMFNYASANVVDTSVALFAQQMGKTEKDISAVDAIKELLDSSVKSIYYVSIPIYDSITEKDVQDDMSECISYMSPAQSGAEMAKDIKIAAAISAHENKIITTQELFETYADILDITATTEYESYTSYKDAYKNIFANFFSKQKNDIELDSKEYKTIFSDAVVITDLSLANGIDAVDEVIEKYQSHFDLAKYSKHKTASCKAIAQGFEKNTVNTIADVQKIMDESTTASPTPKPSSGGGGGGGGSAGTAHKTTGGAIGNPSVPIVTDIPSEPVNIENDYAFNDLENVEWAQKEIEYLAKTGVLAGYNNNTFAPTDSLTRAQACKVLCKMLTIIEDNSSVNFSDVDASSWYSGFVGAANKAQLVFGQTDTLFGAESEITREDFIVMLKRALDKFSVTLPEEIETVTFTDADSISDYAAEGVTAFQKAGIIGGRDDGTFDPKGKINRAEAAKIIYNVKMLYEGRIK